MRRSLWVGALALGLVVVAACVVSEGDLEGARCSPSDATSCGTGSVLVCSPATSRCVLKERLDAGLSGGGAGGSTGGGTGGVTGGGTGGASGGGTGGATGGGTGGAVDAGCPSPTVSCAGLCVDTRYDRAHCNSCSNACDSGKDCDAGVCACPPGQQVCGTGSSAKCTTVNVDPANCGACGVVCPGMCVNGTCSCTSPLNACPIDGGWACVNTSSDPANCQACGLSCGWVQACNAGSCSSSPGTDCNNKETIQVPAPGSVSSVSGTTVGYHVGIVSLADAGPCSGPWSGPQHVYVMTTQTQSIPSPLGTITLTPSAGWKGYLILPRLCGSASAGCSGAVTFDGGGTPVTMPFGLASYGTLYITVGGQGPTDMGSYSLSASAPP